VTDHLRPIEPAAAVHKLCNRLATEILASEYTIELELLAFRETCTPHDARRLANALRHIIGRPDLAGEVEALLLA
jgi:hypothetical protein